MEALKSISNIEDADLETITGGGGYKNSGMSESEYKFLMDLGIGVEAVSGLFG